MKIRKIFDNLEIKLICLLLAVVMWLYATRQTGTWRIFQGGETAEHVDITFHKVPVKLAGREGRWEPVPDEISLEVRCLGAEVDVSMFPVIVSLTREDEEARSVNLNADSLVLPEQLVFVKATPSLIKLQEHTSDF